MPWRRLRGRRARQGRGRRRWRRRARARAWSERAPERGAVGCAKAHGHGGEEDRATPAMADAHTCASGILSAAKGVAAMARSTSPTTPPRPAESAQDFGIGHSARQQAASRTAAMPHVQAAGSAGRCRVCGAGRRPSAQSQSAIAVQPKPWVRGRPTWRRDGRTCCRARSLRPVAGRWRRERRILKRRVCRRIGAAGAADEHARRKRRQAR